MSGAENLPELWRVRIRATAVIHQSEKTSACFVASQREVEVSVLRRGAVGGWGRHRDGAKLGAGCDGTGVLGREENDGEVSTRRDTRLLLPGRRHT